MDILLKIFITTILIEKTEQLRLVVNTTCLELAKPSNQQLRLSCNDTSSYHCLLDETFIQEIEVCRDWKWIPEGHCAYFNTYGNGNIDGRPCVNSNLVCPTRLYSSAEITNYKACYVKKTTSPIEPTTRILQVTSDWTSDGRTSRYSPNSDTSNKQYERRMVAFPIVFGIILLVILIAVIFYFVRSKYVQRHLKENEETPDEDSSYQFQDFVPSHYTLIAREDKEESVKWFDDTFESLKGIANSIENEETPDEGSSYQFQDFVPSHYTQIAMEDKEDSVKWFDDTFESLKRIANSIDEEDSRSCQELYNLLFDKGLELSREVMCSFIKRTTEKPNKELSGDDTIKNELKKVLPDELVLLAKEEDKSFHAVYALIQTTLDKKHYPKSGWGNPVRDTDIGIGDDVERLNRIKNIFRDMPNQVELSVQSYLRLLDIMIEALTRLDHTSDFKEGLRTFSKERERIQMLTKPENILCTDTTTLL